MENKTLDLRLMFARLDHDGELNIVEVEIIKETEKQYKIKNTSRAIVNKSELNKYISYHGIYFYAKDLLVVLEFLKNKIAQSERTIELETKRLANLRESAKKVLGVLNK